MHNDRSAIEAEIGHSVEWERLDARRACRINSERAGDIFGRDQWPEMIPFMVTAMTKLEQVLKPRILRIAGRLG